MLKKLKVGGLIYDVVPVQWEENADGDLQFGIFNANKTNILINELISKQVQKQTLIHEMMHAIFFEAGIEVENEEDLVNRISTVLYQVLQDNDFNFMRNINVGENKIYVEGDEIGIKSNETELNGQVIGELSQRIDALDSKVNLKADKRDLDSVF